MYLLGHYIILKFSKDLDNKLSAASSFFYTNSRTGQSAINLESKLSLVLLLTLSHLKYTSFMPSATGISNLIPNFFAATFTSGTTSHPRSQRIRRKLIYFITISVTLITASIQRNSTSWLFSFEIKGQDFWSLGPNEKFLFQFTAWSGLPGWWMLWAQGARESTWKWKDVSAPKTSAWS